MASTFAGSVSSGMVALHGANAGSHYPETYTAAGVTVYLRAGIEDYPGIGP